VTEREPLIDNPHLVENLNMLHAPVIAPWMILVRVIPGCHALMRLPLIILKLIKAL
jgi:hypothetical protein